MVEDRRPTILHVVHSLHGGGTERTLVSVLRALDPDRFGHIVVTLRAAGSLAARLPDHVACHPLGIVGRSRLGWVRLAGLTRACRATIVHARNTGCWPDAIAASLLTPRARLVLGHHGLETDRGFSRRQARWARLASRIGARFTTVSEAGLRELADGARVPVDRIDLLRNGVNLHQFAPLGCDSRRQTRAALGLADDALLVGTVGSLTAVKEQGLLVRAVARAAPALPELRLWIIGEGPLRAELERLVHTEGVADRVRFLGWREDVARLLGCMDVYACSSASEGMNNALLEAMACGVPAIATSVGDNALLVRDGREGLIVRSGEDRALTGALVTLGQSRAHRQRIGKAARLRAREFDFSGAVRRYETYYRKLGVREVPTRQQNSCLGSSARQASPEPVR